MRYFRRIYQTISSNFLLIGVLGIYVLMMLSVVTWGIPGKHIFTYHMDEWHQLEAVRGLFKNGSNNISGAAHGPILHFLLAGIYLIPFYLFQIVNPFLIKSSTTQLLIQERLFVILRMNTLLYGVLSIVLMYKIARDYLKINVFPVLILFVFTPLWLSLSSFFKYDVAVTWWIILFIYSALYYHSNPTSKRFFMVCICAGLALASKISVLPIIPLIILGFLFLTPSPGNHIKRFIVGSSIFLLTFIIVGIPDVVFHARDYGEYLYSNIVTVPASTENYKFGMPYIQYALTQTLPQTFGILGFSIFLIVFIIGVGIIFQVITKKKKIKDMRVEAFLLCGFLLFLNSILPLKLYAWGNRAVVLLPFIVLLAGLYIHRFLKNVPIRGKVLILLIVLVAQLLQSFVVVAYKYHNDPREDASLWINDHIPQESILGIQNIPIYQGIPDIALYEYYASQNDSHLKTRYNYQVVDEKSKNLPKTVIVTSKNLNTQYLKQSDTKRLISRLDSEGYIIVKDFKVDRNLYAYFENELGMYASGLLPITQITIYQKP